jgi:S1-C subfamily serine protease
MRGMALGGLSLVDLTDEERATRKLPITGMALFAKGLGQYGKHGTAKKAGFQKEDVIIALDGITERKTEAQILAHLLRHRLPGQQVSVTLLRNGKQLTLDLPMQ